MMNTENITKSRPQDRSPNLGGGIDPLLILNLILRNWYLFAISIVLALLLARFYISHTMPTYQTSVTVLINDTEDSSTAWDICMKLAENGLLAKPTHGNIIRFAPPLVMTEEQLHDCISIITKTLSEFERV